MKDYFKWILYCIVLVLVISVLQYSYKSYKKKLYTDILSQNIEGIKELLASDINFNLTYQKHNSLPSLKFVIPLNQTGKIIVATYVFDEKSIRIHDKIKCIDLNTKRKGIANSVAYDVYKIKNNSFKRLLGNINNWKYKEDFFIENNSDPYPQYEVSSSRSDEFERVIRQQGNN